MLSRRDMLRRASTGFGMVALSSLLNDRAFAGAAASTPHFAPKVKSVIFAYMAGGVSQVDTFDPKPELKKRHGKPMPVPVRPTMFNSVGNILSSPYEFSRHGKSGLEISSIFPRLATCADDLAIIRSMTSKASEHAQANYLFHTTQPAGGFPSAGAWIQYGLGSESQDLPGFVVLGKGNLPHGGVGLFGSGFLPAQHQAAHVNAMADEPLANIRSTDRGDRRRQRLEFLRAAGSSLLEQSHQDARLEATIRSFELATRMQSAVPALVDITGETDECKSLYGVDSTDKQKAGFAKQCLLARRLVERGVRFIELGCTPYYIGGGEDSDPWDQHAELKKGHAAMANQVDQPLAALITDLKRRGLFESTLVLFSSEFGRTPFSQGADGRDHNPFGYSIWMAGGGVRGGISHGATDDFGYNAVEKPVTIYDLWATVLHLLGIDHERLTYRYAGRDVRLTDVHGELISSVLA